MFYDNGICDQAARRVNHSLSQVDGVKYYGTAVAVRARITQVASQ